MSRLFETLLTIELIGSIESDIEEDYDKQGAAGVEHTLISMQCYCLALTSALFQPSFAVFAHVYQTFHSFELFATWYT